MKNVTIKEIAKEAGVSHTTVSRALKHDPRIREQTGEKIRRIAGNMGYVPNLVARSFVRGKTLTLGIVISYLGNSFLAEIMQGIEQVAGKLGYVNLVGNSNEDPLREALYIRTFAERRVDGLILYPAHEDCLESHIQLLEDLDLPFILVDKYSESRSCDYVVCDDTLGGRLATEHLTGLGHRRIGLITTTPCTSLNNRRLGYRQALESAGISYLESLCIQGAFDRTNGRYDAHRQTVALMSQQDPPTALFVATDGLVPGVIRAVREAGLSIPDDVSVVGFGDVPSIAFMDVPLTTVAYPTREVGEMAAQRLLKRIEGELPSGRFQGISLRPNLKIRKSTAPNARQGKRS